MKKNSNDSRNGIWLLLICFFIIVLVIGISFAWLNIKLSGGKTNRLRAGYLSLSLDESATEGISINKAIPVSNKEGLSEEGYTFKLVNSGKNSANYTIYLDDLDLDDSIKRMPDEVVKYSLTKNGEEGQPILLSEIGANPKRILDTGVINGTTTNTYTLKLWIDSNATVDVMNTVFSAQLRVEAEQQNIEVEKSDLTVDLDDSPKELELDDNISNYTIESSDPAIATLDATGKIIARGYGIVTFRTKNKITGAKKNITVTITKTLKATYIKQTGAKEIERETDTCLLTEKDQVACSVDLPEITANEGYTSIGWNKDKTSHTGITTKMNISDDTNIYTIIKKDAITYTAKFNKPNVGVVSISNTKLSCIIKEVYNEEQQETSCKIRLPFIDTDDGYTAIGWNEEESAITGNKPNTEIELSGNKEYYGIVKKNSIILTASFVKNGALSQDKDDSEIITKSCVLDETYNGEIQKTECEVNVPTIEASSVTPNVIGYSENKESVTASVQPNTKLILNSNKTYYAITKSDIKTYTATFNLNGAKTLTNSSGISVASNVTRTCNIPSTYNGVAQVTSCNVRTPIIEASNETPTICGYETSPEGKTVCNIKNNSDISLSGDASYYAQTYKESLSKKANFKIASTTTVSKIENKTSVENTTDTLTEICNVPTVYNGEKQASSCIIKTPTIIPAIGYQNPYWGISVSSTSGSSPGATLTIEKEETYYANASATTHTVTYDSITNGGTTNTVKKNVDYNSAIDLTLIANKPGYTFKGWNTSKNATKGLSSLKMSTEDIVLYAIFVDETAPKCSFSTSDAIGLNTEATLTLTCEDNGSGIVPPKLTVSDFKSTKNGSITSISDAITLIESKKYSYEISIKGIHAGSFTVELLENKIGDISGNKNRSLVSDAINVEKGSIKPTVNMEGYTYNGSITHPTISGNVSGGAVTYYYNKTNSNNGGLRWDTVTSSTAINAGTYYMYAVVDATDDYNKVITAPVKFTVEKAIGKVNLSESNGSVLYGNATKTFEVTENISTGDLSVSDDNDIATSSINGSIITIKNLEKIDASTKIKVVVKSAATTNYKEATATYTLVINKANIDAQVVMEDYTFAAEKSIPSVTGNIENGNVTYYYNTVNSTSEGTEWNSVTSSSSLPVGTYYIYAVVDSTKNYNGTVTPTSTFTINGINRKAVFNSNGNTLSVPVGCSRSGESVICNCITTGTSLSCNITSPIITAPSNTPKIIGYSLGKTIRSSSVNSGVLLILSSDQTYYAQTEKEKVTYTATFTKGEGIGSVGSTSQSCTIAATYNGAAQKNSCTISASSIPSVTAIEGYTTNACPNGYECNINPGWFNDLDERVLNISGSDLTLLKNSTYIAKARMASSSEISYNNSTSGLVDSSGNNCNDVQCAIDSLNRILE